MVAPSRQLSEAGCKKSKQKDRADQTGFGMGREILSTHHQYQTHVVLDETHGRMWEL